MLNRTQQPNIQLLRSFDLPSYSIEKLDNGIPVILFDAGEQAVTKIDLMFHAGSWNQNKPLIALSTSELLKSGTPTLTSRQIADQIDFYGAHLFTSANRDMGAITTFSLNKYLPEMVSLMEKVVKYPTFPENEILTHIQHHQQRLKLNQQKVDYLSRIHLSNKLFGDAHPYGRYLKEEHFSNISIQALKDFHQQFYHADNCYIMACGKLPKNLMEILNKSFGGTDWNGHTPELQKYTPNPAAPGRYNIHKKDAVQSGIRIGKILFTRDHPDYHPMKVMNTIFGGYFGSRLMKNIREDKGYTYGIYSSISALKHEGVFAIGTETGKDVTEKAITEIFNEIDKLQQDLVPEEELQTVKNYLLGNVLKMVDGAFAAGDYFKILYDFNLDENYFYHFVDTIKNISPEQIRTLAQKHLKPEELTQIIAGS